MFVSEGDVMKLRIDELDLQIIEALKESSNPRKLASISRSLAVSRRTFYDRVKKLRQRKILGLHLIPKYNLLGLVSVLVFLDYSDLQLGLEEDFLHSRFVILKSRIVGKYNGVMALMTLPDMGVNKVYEKLIELKSVGKIERWRLLITANPRYISPKPSVLKRFVKTREEKLLSESSLASEVNFNEPQDYRILADDIDVLIINMLQKDGWTRLSEIARKLGKSKALVKYHFDKHVLKLTDTFFIDFNPYDRNSLFSLLIEAEFKSEKGLKRFASFLSRLPFSQVLLKTPRVNLLYDVLKIPSHSISMLRMIFSKKVVKRTLLQKLAISVLLTPSESFQLPYELFREKGWILDF